MHSGPTRRPYYSAPQVYTPATKPQVPARVSVLAGFMLGVVGLALVALAWWLGWLTF